MLKSEGNIRFLKRLNLHCCVTVWNRVARVTTQLYKRLQMLYLLNAQFEASFHPFSFKLGMLTKYYVLLSNDVCY